MSTASAHLPCTSGLSGHQCHPPLSDPSKRRFFSVTRLRPDLLAETTSAWCPSVRNPCTTSNVHFVTPHMRGKGSNTAIFTGSSYLRSGSERKFLRRLRRGGRLRHRRNLLLHRLRRLRCGCRSGRCLRSRSGNRLRRIDLLRSRLIRRGSLHRGGLRGSSRNPQRGSLGSHRAGRTERRLDGSDVVAHLTVPAALIHRHSGGTVQHRACDALQGRVVRTEVRVHRRQLREEVLVHPEHLHVLEEERQRVRVLGADDELVPDVPPVVRSTLDTELRLHHGLAVLRLRGLSLDTDNVVVTVGQRVEGARAALDEFVPRNRRHWFDSSLE